MTAAELELWILEVADRVVRGAAVEDSRVECKRAWRSADRHEARQLAAHANGLRGDRFLLIIGLDERERRVTGATAEELANWLPALRKHFDGPVPELLQNIATRHQGGTLVGLLFDTSRAPYVVNLPKGEGSGATLEVPYRVGNSTVSATHEHLIRMLVPRSARPDVTVLSARAQAHRENNHDDGAWSWSLHIETYFDLSIPGHCVIPAHQSELLFRLEGERTWFEAPRLRVAPTYGHQGALLSPMMAGSESELVANGPGRVSVTASLVTPSTTTDSMLRSLIVRATLQPLRATSPVAIDLDLVHEPVQNDRIHEWGFVTRPIPSRGSAGREFPPMAFTRAVDH